MLNTGFILFFLVFKEESALGVIKAKMYASLLLLPVFITIIVRNVKFNFDYEILKNCLKFSMPIIPTIFAAWILGQADRVFIADYLSLHDLGIYSLSRRIAGLIGILAGAFTMAYHPLFFELVNSKTSNNEKLRKINNTFILMIIFWGLCLGFAIKRIDLFVFGPKIF